MPNVIRRLNGKEITLYDENEYNAVMKSKVLNIINEHSNIKILESEIYNDSTRIKKLLNSDKNFELLDQAFDKMRKNIEFIQQEELFNQLIEMAQGFENLVYTADGRFYSYEDADRNIQSLEKFTCLVGIIEDIFTTIK